MSGGDRHPFSVEFGEWVRAARKRKGINQTNLTRALGAVRRPADRGRSLGEPLPHFEVAVQSLCATCGGLPPAGFACRSCGAES